MALVSDHHSLDRFGPKSHAFGYNLNAGEWRKDVYMWYESEAWRGTRNVQDDDSGDRSDLHLAATDLFFFNGEDGIYQLQQTSLSTSEAR